MLKCTNVPTLCEMLTKLPVKLRDENKRTWRLQSANSFAEDKKTWILQRANLVAEDEKTWMLRRANSVAEEETWVLRSANAVTEEERPGYCEVQTQLPKKKRLSCRPGAAPTSSSPQQ